DSLDWKSLEAPVSAKTKIIISDSLRNQFVFSDLSSFFEIHFIKMSKTEKVSIILETEYGGGYWTRLFSLVGMNFKLVQEFDGYVFDIKKDSVSGTLNLLLVKVPSGD